MLVYLRHGATSLNKGGKEERLRGWLPVPLSELGQQQAHAAGKRLKKLLPHGPDTFAASNLRRAIETAKIVGEETGFNATLDPALRDWNTGKFAGQKVTDVLPQLQGLIHTPEVSAPDGEPLNAYLHRFVPAMRAKVADPRIHLVVGHARGATILEGIASPVGGVGGDIDKAFLLARPRVQPGGLLIIGKTWDTRIDQPEGQHG